MDNSQIWMHPDAYEEALATYDWYAKRNPDAADAFRTELERTKELIVRSPESWPSYIHGTRRCLLRIFPFSIVFRLINGQVQVIAVAHQKRRPGYWKSR